MHSSLWICLKKKLLSYCNNIYNTDGGTHLTGFKTKFTQEINSYAKELGILKDPAKFTGPDTRCGMTAIIAIKHQILFLRVRQRQNLEVRMLQRQ